MTDPRFDPAQVFAVFDMRHVDSAGFDAAVVQAPGSDLRCVFLWGQDCYNCNLFKQAALLHQETLLGLGLTSFEADVYADEPWAVASPCMASPLLCFTGPESGSAALPVGPDCPSSRRRSGACRKPRRKIPARRLENPAGSPSYVGTGNFSPISQIYPR